MPVAQDVSRRVPSRNSTLGLRVCWESSPLWESMEAEGGLSGENRNRGTYMGRTGEALLNVTKGWPRTVNGRKRAKMAIS